MNSKEACAHPICELSRRLYHSVVRIRIDDAGDIIDQLARSVLSVGSNWCEGLGKRGTAKSSSAFFRHARGSGYEAAFQLSAIGREDLEALAHEMCDIMDKEIDSTPESGSVDFT